MGNFFDELIEHSPSVNGWDTDQLLKDVAKDAEIGVAQSHRQTLELVEAVGKLGFGAGDQHRYAAVTRTVLVGYMIQRIQQAHDEAKEILSRPDGFEQIEAIVQVFKEKLEAEEQAKADSLKGFAKDLEAFLKDLESKGGKVNVVDPRDFLRGDNHNGSIQH